MRTIDWTRPALKDMAALEHAMRLRVRAAVETLAATGQGDVKALKGRASPRYRLRVGDYRVVFENAAGALVIHGVAHRREVYR